MSFSEETIAHSVAYLTAAMAVFLHDIEGEVPEPNFKHYSKTRRSLVSSKTF